MYVRKKTVHTGFSSIQVQAFTEGLGTYPLQVTGGYYIHKNGPKKPTKLKLMKLIPVPTHK